MSRTRPARTLKIKDDDGTPTVTLRLDPEQIDEQGGVSTVTATLDHASSADTTVTVAAAALDPPGETYFTQTGTTLTIAGAADDQHRHGDDHGAGRRHTRSGHTPGAGLRRRDQRARGSTTRPP